MGELHVLENQIKFNLFEKYYFKIVSVKEMEEPFILNKIAIHIFNVNKSYFLKILGTMVEQCTYLKIIIENNKIINYLFYMFFCITEFI